MLDRIAVFMVRRSWRLYQSAGFVTSTRYRGALLRVPIIKGVGLELLASREAWLVPLVEAAYRLRRGGFIDVGSNIGQALLVLAAIDRSIPYTAFEPNVAAAFYVDSLIRANGLENHRVFPVALGLRNGAAKLRLDNPFDVSASLVADFRPSSFYASAKQVLVWNGDEAMSAADVGEIAFLKLDVEGNEVEVMRGLERTLMEKRPWCAVEVLAYAGVESGRIFPELGAEERGRIVAFRRNRIKELDRVLDDLRYDRFFVVDEGKVAAVADLTPMGEGTENNFLLVPREERTAFLEIAGDAAGPLAVIPAP